MSGLAHFLIRNGRLWLFLFLFFISLKLTYRQNQLVQYNTDRILLELTGRINNIGQFWTDLILLKKNNRQLAEENARLYNLYLNQTKTYQGIQGFEVFPAKVVSRFAEGKNYSLIVNKGKNDGIEPGTGVWAPEGLVGIVNKVSANFAKIWLWNHPHMHISVQLKNKNIYGFTTHSPEKNQILVTDFPEEALVRQGDTIVTSGMSLIFPQGIPVGIIEKSYLNKEKEKIIWIHPFTDINKLLYVYISKHKNKAELQALKNER